MWLTLGRVRFASIRQVLEAAGIEFLSLREDSEGCTPPGMKPRR
jgi:hypothetical protein